jgi:hypothetical protein
MCKEIGETADNHLLHCTQGIIVIPSSLFGASTITLKLVVVTWGLERLFQETTM